MFLFTCLLLGTSLAQDSDLNPPSEKSSDKVPGVLGQFGVKPEGFYHLNRNGERIMVPGMSFEEIQELLDLREQLIPATEDYSIEEVVVDGAASEDQLLLTIEVRMRVDPRKEGWTQVPLSLPGIYLAEDPMLEGGENFHFELAKGKEPSEGKGKEMGEGNGAQRGYLLRVKVAEQKQVVFRGKFRAPIRDVGGSAAVDLLLPVANTQLAFLFPRANLNVQTTSRGEEIRSKTVVGEKLKIEIDSDGGQVSLRWQLMDAEPTVEQVLDAEGRWVLKMSSAADRLIPSLFLAVRNLRGPLEPFEIVVPESVLIAESTFQGNPAWRINPVPGTKQTRWQVVPAEGDDDEQVELRLDFEMIQVNPSAAAPFQFPSIEVSGTQSQPAAIVRQWGQIQVEVPEGNRLRWIAGPSVRSVETELVPSADNNRVYVFEYTRVPVELRLWTEDPQEQLRLAPRMEIGLANDRAELTFLLRGATTVISGEPLKIDLNGWQVRSLDGPSGPLPVWAYHLLENQLIVEPDAIISKEPGNRATPLQLRVRMERPLLRESFALTLPQLASGESSTNSRPLNEATDLEVRTSPDWLFYFDREASSGLDTRSTSLPNGQILLREVPSAKPMTLAGALRPNQQRVGCATQIEVTHDGKQLEFIQSFTLAVESFGLRSIRVATKTRSGTPLNQPSVDGAAMMAATIDGVPALVEEREGELRLNRGEVLEPGTHRVVLRRQYGLTSDLEGLITLPVSQLEIPGIQISAEVPIKISAGEGLRVELLAGERPLEKVVPLETLLTEGLRARTRVIPATVASQRIERLWLQSWLGPTKVRERATMLLREPQGRLRLPAEGLPAHARISAKVAGKASAMTRSTEGNFLEVKLPPTNERLSVEITLWWDRRPDYGFPRRFRPLLERWGQGIEQVYWQMILPKNELAIELPSGSASAMRWQWDNWRFRRVALMEDAQLAERTGAKLDSSNLVGNRYLVTTIGGMELQATIIERSVLWGVVAGIVLLSTTLLLYVRWTRHPLSIVAMSLLALSVAYLWPDASLIIGQLAVVAGLFVVLMLLVRGLVLRQPQRSALTPRMRADESRRGAIRPVPTRELKTTRTGDLSIKSGEARVG